MNLLCSKQILALVVALSLPGLTVQARSPAPPDTLSEAQLLACERKLSELGYWVEAVDGIPDESTLAAIKTFRRLNKYKNLGSPNSIDLSVLSNAKPLAANPHEGARFIVDLTWQVMFFVGDDGRTSHLLPVSTGSGQMFTEGGWSRRARTPKGRFTVYRKASGWRQSSLGQMYYPNYIIGGVSIHGSTYVADYPRTHGCIAVPMFAAEKLSELMPIGSVVVIRD